MLLMMTCNHQPIKRSKYQINGFVMVDSVKYECIWLADSLEYRHDTASYRNLDGTLVMIYPPYKIKKNY